MLVSAYQLYVLLKKGVDRLEVIHLQIAQSTAPFLCHFDGRSCESKHMCVHVYVWCVCMRVMCMHARVLCEHVCMCVYVCVRVCVC